MPASRYKMKGKTEETKNVSTYVTYKKNKKGKWERIGVSRSVSTNKRQGSEVY